MEQRYYRMELRNYLGELDLRTPKFVEDSGITKEDVWGKYDENYNEISSGMIVAKSGDICPVNKDVLPHKSVAVTCTKDQAEVVFYWLEFVLGANCIQGTNENLDGKITIRADYQCW